MQTSKHKRIRLSPPPQLGVRSPNLITVAMVMEEVRPISAPPYNLFESSRQFDRLEATENRIIQLVINEPTV